MDLLARVTASERASFLLPCPLWKLSATGVVRIEGLSFCVRMSGLKVWFSTQRSVLDGGFPISNDLI